MLRVIDNVQKPLINSWFITQTICPKLYTKSAELQFALTLNPFLKILEKYCYNYSYVTELTEHANVHYHAWIELRNDNNKYRLINEIKKTRNLGFCMINKERIEDIERTYAYMVDSDLRKMGKNLQAAYNLILKPEVAGSKNNLNFDLFKGLIRNQPILINEINLIDYNILEIISH